MVKRAKKPAARKPAAKKSKTSAAMKHKLKKSGTGGTGGGCGPY